MIKKWKKQILVFKVLDKKKNLSVPLCTTDKTQSAWTKTNFDLFDLAILAHKKGLI